MQAQDIMTDLVLAVSPDTSVAEAAKLMADNGISAVPVTDDDNQVIGIASEGDLLRRAETGTGPRRSWWLELLIDPEHRAADYVKSHGRKVSDVMTRGAITVAPDAPLEQIAELLEQRHVKRVPVVDDGRLVGVVSRANIVQALAVCGRNAERSTDSDDRAVRDAVNDAIRNDAKLSEAALNVIVEDGAVYLWGIVGSAAEKRAIEVAAENTAGVERVESRLSLYPVSGGGGY